MGGMVIFGACLIGGTLILGRQLFPDSVVMWFTSPDAGAVIWRDLVFAGLLLLAVAREYYHNLYLQITWAAAAVGLLWTGGLYFLNNPSYVFDVLLLLNAGVAFAISALVPCAEPVNARLRVIKFLPRPLTARYASRRLQFSADRLASWRYISDSRELSHRLVLGE